MKRALRAGVGLHELVLVALLAAVIGLAELRDPDFLAPLKQLDLSIHSAELILLALPMTLIILSAGIDLSVGSTLALATVILGLMHQSGAPIWLAALGAVLTGTAAGALNGLFVARLRVHPLIVTLATLAAYRGLAEGLSLGESFSNFPAGFQFLGTGAILYVPIPLLIGLVAVIATLVLAAGTPLGFRIYAIGDNEPAARYAGIPVDRIKFLLYTLSGTVAGLAGVVLASRRNTGKADLGAGLELEAITAVVLGGTSIRGGRGRILGTVLGVVLIHEIREFVSWHWEQDELILIVIGAILIASVLLNNLASRRRS